MKLMNEIDFVHNRFSFNYSVTSFLFLPLNNFPEYIYNNYYLFFLRNNWKKVKDWQEAISIQTFPCVDECEGEN